MSTADRIAAHLAACLADAMPIGFRANMGAAASIVVITPTDSMTIDVAAVLREDGEPRLEIEAGVLFVLSSVQDAVVEELREPWPSSGESGALPLPRADIDHGRLSAGYSVGETWILKCLDVDVLV